jgi:OmpA family
MDEATEITKDAHDTTLTLLSSLPLEYKGSDVVQALNGWVVNFSEGGAEFPSDARDIAARAAAKLRSISEPVVLEVAVHVDSHHHDASDMTLTEERGNSIRDAMIKAGLPQGMLKVKAYGSLKPLAANDTPWGRFRNRRVEFRVLSVCNAANPCAGMGSEGQKAKVQGLPGPSNATVPAEPGTSSPQAGSVQKSEANKTIAVPQTKPPVVETEQKSQVSSPTSEEGEPVAKPKPQPAAPRPVKAEDLF